MNHPAVGEDCVVELRSATLPSLLGAIALHHWFCVWDTHAGRWERWEVWQTREAGGTSWGHVHRDLMHPHSPVGGGPSRVEAVWSDARAAAIRRALAESPRYPHRDRYLAWPGPNSNTFVDWVLRRAGVPYRLDPRGIGKDYLGLWGARHCTVNGTLQIETPAAGLRVGAGGHVELHFLCLAFGLDLRPLRLRTPFGPVPVKAAERGGAKRILSARSG